MKKIYFFTLGMVCLSFISQAQISKGSTFLGGSISIHSNTNEIDVLPTIENKSTSWSISPQFGKAIAANKILGVFLSYGNLNNEQIAGTNKSLSEASSYGAGLFYRSYYSLSNRFYLFGEGTLGVGITRNESSMNEIISNKRNVTAISAGLTPGISFAASRKIHLEASLNSLLQIAYSFSKNEDYDGTGTVYRTTKGNQFDANVNANGFSGISIGIRWILPSGSSK